MADQVDLVFRTVGERTSRLALRLAMENIQPAKVHVLENINPFWRTVQKMLEIPFRCETVVFMDADCLILEDLRPFLEKNTYPHIDACVLDKFRGRVPAGVHITRADVVERMSRVVIDHDDPRYYLKPESWIRSHALQQMGKSNGLKRFQILHDFEQYYEHIFIKLVLRELRSRKWHTQLALAQRMNKWNFDDMDFLIAKQAVDYSRNNFCPGSGKDVHDLLSSLPEIAQAHIQKIGLKRKDDLSNDGVVTLRNSPMLQSEFMRPPISKKIIGMGLCPTELKYLKWAMEVFGLIISPSYTAAMTENSLSLGISPQSIQDDFDGLIGVALSPYYHQLINEFPSGQFILVKGNPEQWVSEMETKNSSGRNLLSRTARQILLGQEFDSSAIEWVKVYQDYYYEANEYLKRYASRFLLFDLTKGHSWKELCTFLQLPLIQEPFFGQLS